MPLRKLRESCPGDNDMYFIEAVSGRLAVNDNYVGLHILDNRLNVVRDIRLYDGLLIYSSYIRPTAHDLILYCPDNERLVHVDVVSGDWGIIDVRGELAEAHFTQYYVWTAEALTAYVSYGSGGDFYKVDVARRSVARVGREAVAARHPLFYQFWLEGMQEPGRREINSNEYQLIAIDEERSVITLRDFRHRQTYTVATIGSVPHEVLFSEGTFVLVREGSIEVSRPGARRSVVQAEEPYQFLRARFLRNRGSEHLAVLSSNKAFALDSCTSIYRIVR